MLFPHQLPSRKQLAAVALENVTREFPYAAHHVQRDHADLKQPVDMHPAFGNSFDWHSSVHMHWLLTQLLEAEYESEGLDAPWAQQALTILTLSLIHISEPTRREWLSRMPSSA